jgi:hypothetical protein
MSAEKKLYALEVNPPQQVWDKLALALDELQFENSYKKKLQGLNTNPPARVWEKIENQLDAGSIETSVAAKLLNISEAPPADTWANIDSQLTEDTFNQKFSGLKNLEVTPPENNWNKILTTLETGTKVIPIKRTKTPFIRYAAAAVIIGVFAWGSVQLMSGNKTSENNLANDEIKQPVKESTPEVTNNLPPENSTPVVIPEEKPVEIIASNTTTKPKIRRTGMNTVSLASVTAPQTSHTNSEEIIADINSIKKNKPAETATIADPSAPRYLVYLNDDGELMKVSKKLADMKCLYNKKNGEISQDALASINNKVCNDLVKSWQEKLSKTPLNLSFNPLEMADILK